MMAWHFLSGRKQRIDGDPRCAARATKRIVNPFSISRLALLSGLFLALVFAANTASARNYYGAIAYSPATRSVGYSYNFHSRSGAERDALGHCRRGDCVVVIWFRNACGALAVSRSSNHFGSGWSGNLGTAERIALNSCRASDCYVARWACTAR